LGCGNFGFFSYLVQYWAKFKLHLKFAYLFHAIGLMIEREIEPHIKKLSKQYPVITITGPRQSGKTTLVKKMFY